MLKPKRQRMNKAEKFILGLLEDITPDTWAELRTGAQDMFGYLILKARADKFGYDKNVPPEYMAAMELTDKLWEKMLCRKYQRS